MRALPFALLTVALAATGYGVHCLLQPAADAAAGPATAVPAAGEPAYVCPMHPAVRLAQAGRCPLCGMALALHAPRLHGDVILDPGRRQRFGVRTQAVQPEERALDLRAAATIVYDEARRTAIAPRFGGFVRSIYATMVGARVARGDALLSLYSPELIAAEADYLSAWSAHAPAEPAAGDGGTTLLALARTKLARLGMPADQLADFERQPRLIEDLIIRAPADGTVVERSVQVGARIEAGATAVLLADLSRVWLEAEVPAQDLADLRVGQELTVRSPDDAALALHVPLGAILPQVDALTRAGRIRAELANPDGRLRPGMLLECSITVPLGRLLAIPTDALIIAGELRVVFVDAGDGHFRPQRIVTGRTGAGWTEVSSGLAAGAQVVTQGLFLLAAESRLATGLEQW